MTRTWPHASERQGLVATAKAAIARGWPVFPMWGSRANGLCACGDLNCENAAKHPLGLLVPHGIKDATILAPVASRWFQQYPDANLAMVTGRVSKIVVLDIDAKHGGPETLRELEAQHGALPMTLAVKTGGGGDHYYFRCQAGGMKSTAIAPGVEIRGDGAAAILPPSVHASGQPYTWAAGRSPDDVPLADLPTWIMEMTTQPAATTNGLGAAGEIIREGRRNITLTSLSGTMSRWGMTESVPGRKMPPAGVAW